MNGLLAKYQQRIIGSVHSDGFCEHSNKSNLATVMIGLLSQLGRNQRSGFSFQMKSNQNLWNPAY